MYIQQLYTSCLSEAAYYIESAGEAAIIDPLRDIDMYIQLAESRGAKIKYILETHFHADFVSGHLDLAKATGAPIIYGPETRTSYPVTIVQDGAILPLGELSFEVLHTPGHTLESTCYLLRDAAQKPHALFSGDTLFVGDVGRPDLSSGNIDADELAGIMFESLQKKILPLPDEVLVYPAHGAGSSCGKNLGSATYSTIGEQKDQNYALRQTDKASFIQEVTEGLKQAPAYFKVNAKINQQGYDPMEEVKARGLQALDIPAFKVAKRTAWIVDTRHAMQFTQGFVPGSISIGLEGRFAEWAGSLLPFDQPILLVAEVGKEEESVVRLMRVGFSQFAGYLAGGFEQWQLAGEPIDMIIDVEPDELAMDIPHDDRLVVVDVRRPSEYGAGHVRDAFNMPLEDMHDVALMAQLEEEQNLYVHCAGGYRSVIAASLMKRQGIHNLRNVLGGWNKIKEEKGIPVESEPAALN